MRQLARYEFQKLIKLIFGLFTHHKNEIEDTFIMTNAKSCIYYAIKKVISEHQIKKIFVPSYGCSDIYVSLERFDLPIEIYDELDGEKLIERVTQRGYEKYLILIVDLLLDNNQLVSQLKDLTNNYVIYDRTNNEIIDDCIADFDIYSLGVAKRNAFGGGGLLKTNVDMSAECINKVEKLKIIINYIVGYILMIPFIYRPVRYIRKSLRNVICSRNRSLKCMVNSFKPCQYIRKINIDFRHYGCSSEYIINKKDCKMRLVSLLRQNEIAADVYGVARLIIITVSEHEKNLSIILNDLGLRIEVSDYIRVSQAGRSFKLANKFDEKNIYFIG